MSSDKIIIAGTGCALADFLYNNISFNSLEFEKFQSIKRGDGGLSPGKLVFTEELEKFSGSKYTDILRLISHNHTPDAFNVGGPSLVSLIHASQMLDSKEFEVKFFGMAGEDDISEKIFEIVRETPLNINNYLTTSKQASPFTDVFSDPVFANGNGERTFINNIGAAWEYSPEYLTNEFFKASVVCFGGTALVPQLHDNLARVLIKARENNCITIVNTVFDFRNEKNNPGKEWPLVGDISNYGLVDILIMDCEEALKISGQMTIEEAANFFSSTDLGTFIITNGPKEIYAKSAGGLFEKTDLIRLPVSGKVKEDLKTSSKLKRDTTGCGDNFTGGIISSVATQLRNKQKGHFNLIETLSWGVASGGFTCFITGGTFIENFPGEKKSKVSEYQMDYLKQISSNGRDTAK